MNQGRTPSERTNLLLERVEAVARGAGDAQALAAQLDEQFANVEALRQEVTEHTEALGDKFVDRHALDIEDAENGLKTYHEALEKIASGLETGDAEPLVTAASAIAQCTAPMLDALGRFHKAYMEFGNSKFVLVNTLRRVALQVQDGQAEMSDLTGALGQALQHFRGAAEEVRASPASQIPAGKEKLEALEQVVAKLEALERALPEVEAGEVQEQGSDEDSAVAALMTGFVQEEAVEDTSWNGSLASLDSALVRLEQADTIVFGDKFLAGPTPMPVANLLLNMSDGVLSGQIPLQSLRESIIWYKEHAAGLEAQFERVMSARTDSVIVLDELPKTREIMDLHAEAVDDLQASLDDFTREKAGPILERIVDTVDRLYDSGRVYSEVTARESRVLCAACGHANPAENRNCASCGAVLPRTAESQMTSHTTFELKEGADMEGADTGGVVTVNIRKLFEAAYLYSEGQVRADNFLDMIDWNRKLIDQARQATNALPEPRTEVGPAMQKHMTPEIEQFFADNKTMFYESRELMYEGLDEWARGLDTMEKYVNDGQRWTLEQGIREVWSGSQKVYQVERIGNIAKNTLADMRKKKGAPAPGEPASEESVEEEQPMAAVFGDSDGAQFSGE